LLQGAWEFKTQAPSPKKMGQRAASSAFQFQFQNSEAKAPPNTNTPHTIAELPA
jgi:hypothetical protein